MKTAIIINRSGMGHGDDGLGEVLIGAFLKKIWARATKPEVIIFYNEGVKLLAQGSAYIDVLDGLETSGVELIACGTCIDHYELTDLLKVGRRSDMNEIVSIMIEAEKVITI